ncbi:MAG: FAD-dependent oxidoreductase [Sneathiellales bacterium]|nr:FAD-dependent oxidoreductase [Sneathiellales bacterium]
MKIAVIGSGISGLSAAWLLSKNHDVDLFEKDHRLGGHANTQIVTLDHKEVAVDTGFIVYNNHTYPNLTALFDLLKIETSPTTMSFAVSSQKGAQEYAGSGLAALFARRLNLINPVFLKMLRDIRRFYAHARLDAQKEHYSEYSLGQYLIENNYSAVFKDDHLLPMGAAIWSMPMDQMLAFPFKSFVQFCDNHGLLQLRDRPQWRTVVGGSKQYVDRVAREISGRIFMNATIDSISRKPGSVILQMREGIDRKYDHIVFACHSDQALRLLKAGAEGPTEQEEDILSAIRYQKNLAILHRDESLMPKRRKVWSAWNYIKGNSDNVAQCVSYWMNALQPLPTEKDLFITLNPVHQPREGDILRSYVYAHPVFDEGTEQAKQKIWSLQGHKRTWFCGAYMGHGFHEDGLQAGLEVAERLGGLKRPWTVENPSGRLHLPEFTQSSNQEAAE